MKKTIFIIILVSTIILCGVFICRVSFEDKGCMPDAERMTFNDRFLKYEGKHKGNMIKALINEVNEVNSQNYADRYVKLIGETNTRKYSTKFNI